MELSESFQVAAIIKKLHPMWRDFKNYHKHKGKETNLKELIVCLRIDEKNKNTKRKFIVQLGVKFVETGSKPSIRRVRSPALHQEETTPRMSKSLKATVKILKKTDIIQMSDES